MAIFHHAYDVLSLDHIAEVVVKHHQHHTEQQMQLLDDAIRTHHRRRRRHQHRIYPPLSLYGKTTCK